MKITSLVWDGQVSNIICKLKMSSVKDNALKTLEESISEEESLLSMAATPFTANRLMARFQLASWKIYHVINLYYKKPSLKKMKVILSFRNRFE
jgi:hypothetical protein